MDHLEKAIRDLARIHNLATHTERQAFSTQAIAHALIALCERLDSITQTIRGENAIRVKDW